MAWDEIYKNFQKGGDAWATLSEGIIPSFVRFIESTQFPIRHALDVGCGTGKYLVYLKAQRFSVAGIDVSPTAVEMTKLVLGEHADVKCEDMFAYVIPEKTFDLIVSISTIHHGLRDQVQACIQKIYAALLPGGKIFITVPDLDHALKWNSFREHQELAPGTYAPLSGPEQGLAHSFYTEQEVRELFAHFKNLQLELDEIGRWIVIGEK